MRDARAAVDWTRTPWTYDLEAGVAFANLLDSFDPPPGAIDRNGLEVLSRAECLALLRTVPVGRVGISMRALPVVLPVSFAVLGDDVVFRTGTGTKLGAAVDQAIVAFEADDVDFARGSGWSVCVTGRASEVYHPDELAAVAALEPAPLVRGSSAHVVRVRSDILTGRRLRPASGESGRASSARTTQTRS